jgi:hypothetical protein
VREPSNLPCGNSPRESLARPKGNALKTENGELNHHVEQRNEIADILNFHIGYLFDQTWAILLARWPTHARWRPYLGGDFIISNEDCFVPP